MAELSQHIRRFAPPSPESNYEIFDDCLGSNPGTVTIEKSDGTQLGAIQLKGETPVRLVLEFAGVSRGSGGELYKAASFFTPDSEHHVIDSLPQVINPVAE